MAVAYRETVDVPLNKLARFPGNARRGDVDRIRESIRRHGQYRALVVRDTGDGLVILAGNHTFDAIKAEGHGSARCEIIECTDDEARRINLADNRLSEIGSQDLDALAELLSYLDDDYEGTGYTEADVERLLTPPNVEELDPVLPGADTVSEPPKDPVTKPGDVWLLGPHRIICGDSRDYDTVAKLLNGATINVAFTSPPYASQRKYDESSGFKPIHPDEYVDWFEDVQANVRALLAEDGSWFVNIKEHANDGQRHLYVKDLTIAHVRRWGWRFVDEFAWTRPGPPGRWPDRFKNGWEPVFHFAKEAAKFRPEAVGYASDAIPVKSSEIGANTAVTNGAYWNRSRESTSGIAFPPNVLSVSGVEPGTGHTAAFPVGLPQFFIRAYSDPGDTVFDPFMGSGTTMIAAHQENRVAYGTEISPAYTDVICRRFQTLTSIKPVLEATGQPHDFTTDT